MEGKHESIEKNGSFLSGELYDILKFLAQILLPAIGTLYFALAGIWNFPDAEKVIGSITAVDTFLGVLLGLSSYAYNNSGAKYDGSIVVSEDVERGKKVFTLELSSDPLEIEAKDEVTFKIESK